MRDCLFRKGLVVGIIVLFIGIAFSPNIIAVDLSKQVSVELNSNTPSSVSEASNKGYDLALVDITPYEFWGYEPDMFILCFGGTVKNVGDTEFTGNVGYSAKAINLRNNKQETQCVVRKNGGLKPGESWSHNYGGYGLRFWGPYWPTPFSLQFTAGNIDSNPENNYLEEKYLIWGGFPGPSYKRIYKTRPINKAYINTPFQWVLEQYPSMFPILRHLLRL